MASFTAVREALAERGQTIDGLNAYARAPGSVETPAWIVTLDPGSFLTWDTSRGTDDYRFVILVLVASSDYDAGQAALDAYLDDPGAASVKDAIEGDQDLGGLAHFVEALEANSPGLHTVGAGEYWGFRVPVTVGVSG